MDMIVEKIQEIVKKIRDDKNFAAKFKRDPIRTVEDLLNIDLPNEQIEAIVNGVKAKIDLDAIGDLLDSDGDGKPDLGAIGKLGGLFRK